MSSNIYLYSNAIESGRRKTGKYFSLVLILVVVLITVSVSTANGMIRIMPLGDSITRGSSSGVDPEAYYISYRKALWNMLNAAGYEIDFVGSLSSGSAIFGDPEHEGHGGWSDWEIVNGRPGEGKLSEWLMGYQPDIVLLHIGTNDLEVSSNDVEEILNVIDNYSLDTWVILARIINRNCSTDTPPCSESDTTTIFNDNVVAMAQDRINTLGDKIILVDMENHAGIDYHLATDNPPGDMWNNVHPYETGYEKMADEWFLGLQEILPMAKAGPDQEVDEGDTVVLDGTRSIVPNDGIVSYLWEQISGPEVTLSGADTEQASFTAPDVGPDGESLEFQLTVSDGGGPHTDTCIVNITWVNVPPIADAGPNQLVEEGVTVTLDGSNSSDPDDGIASYQWTQIGGTSVSLSDTSAVQPTFTVPDVDEDGEALTFQLTVTDTGGLQSTDTCIVNITWVNQPPTADAGPNQLVEEGVTVTLDGSNSSDPDDGIASYLWKQIGGPSVTLSDTTAVQPAFVTPPVNVNPITLTFQLTVEDKGGLQSSDEVSVTINAGRGGCFIATAAYGTAMEPHVVILRDFRDRFLLTNQVGKLFVGLYYVHSPPVADYIANHNTVRLIVRWSLMPIFGMSWMALNIGLIPTLTIILLMLIFINISVVILFRRIRMGTHMT